MVNSYYKCAIGGRFVTVWPAMTGESGFYDVVYGEEARYEQARRASRVTAREAAAYVITELGAPHATSIDSLTRMIGNWRAEYDAEYGNHVVTGACGLPGCSACVTVPS